MNDPEGKEFVDKDGTVYTQHVDEEGNIFIMKKDPVTGKMVKTVVGVKKPKKNKLLTRKDGKAFTKPSAMTEEELLQFKTGKRMSESDSEFSYRSVYSEGGTRTVRRRRRLSDGKYSDSESYDSEKDVAGKDRRLKRRDVREKERVKEEQREKEATAKKEKALAGDRKEMNSAASFYSYVSDGGTRHVKKKGRQREDGTFSDDESMAGDYKYDKTKKKRAIKDYKKKKPAEPIEETKKKMPGQGGAELTPRTPTKAIHTTPVVGGEGEDGEDSDKAYSIHSEVSEGGTRRVFKKKKILDEQGNVIGYGQKELVDADSDEESVRIRRGSIVTENDAAEMKATKELFKKLQEMIGDDDSGSKVGPGGVRMVQGEDGKWYPVKSRDAKGVDDPDIAMLDIPKSSVIPVDDDGVPLDFSDDSDDDPDLSHMTEEEKQQYFEARDKRRAEREDRMRAKYGDKYDDMMKLRKLQKEKENAERQKRQEEADAKHKAQQQAIAAEEEKHPKIAEKQIRRTSSSLLPRTPKKPKSMVSYQTGSARDISGPITKSDNRNLGPGHDEWSKKGKPKQLRSPAKKVKDPYDPFNFKPIKLPIILQGKELDLPDTAQEDQNGARAMSRARKEKSSADERKKDKGDADDYDDIDMDLFEVGADGKLRLKEGVTLDLSRLSSATLRKLGIDPTLSKEEIIKRIQQKLGSKVTIKDGDRVIQTGLGIDADIGTSAAADDDEDKMTSYRGRRRVNLLMQRGGQVLLNHMKRILDMCNTLKDDYAKNLDEKDGSINFLAHYRLVEPEKLESYAKAFVVEDRDMDTVINFDETKIALDGVADLECMTNKQANYVLKVLHIDDASMVTFRMFAVITALCERVTRMDTISKKLLELCNLADIERKLELYKSMFYHNVSSDRVANFITAESLKIELIAGGLNWKQQNYIMEKMEPNSWGEISFLDYMCYIPLFLSLHDNIISNPFDMSDEKYIMPPRKRPPSPQRDMNPLGQPLSKKSSFLMKRQARDYAEGKLGDQMMGEDSLDKIQMYSKMTDIETFDKPVTSTPVESDSEYEKIDLIY